MLPFFFGGGATMAGVSSTRVGASKRISKPKVADKIDVYKRQTYGYRTSPLASSVVRTSVTVRNVIGRVNTDYCLTGTVNAGGKTINYTHKGGVCASVPQYNACLLYTSSSS